MDHTLTVYRCQPFKSRDLEVNPRTSFTEGALVASFDERTWCLWPRPGQKLVKIGDVWNALEQGALEAILSEETLEAKLA